MSDILKIVKDIEDRLWNQYGDPIAKNPENHDRIQMTYYLSRLMEERGHKYIWPSRISGPKEDRGYYSEKALQEAFEAGRLLAKADKIKMRTEIVEELRSELHAAIDGMDL